MTNCHMNHNDPQVGTTQLTHAAAAVEPTVGMSGTFFPSQHCCFPGYGISWTEYITQKIAGRL